MIDIKNLNKTYHTQTGDVVALKNINMVVNEGEIYGVIGLSGAGKSSLVRCINQLEKPTSGQIIVDNIDLTKSTGHELRNSRKKIGMVFQHFNLLMNKTIYQNIAFPMQISKYSKNEIETRVTELLDLVGLSDKRDVYPAQLSGGQKQRVGIARAIAGSPSVIMCDEATSALDPSTTKSILNLLKDINEKLNITIIVITHEMDVIKELCHKVAIMECGEIIESGEVSEILVNPQTDTAKEFFNKVDLKTTNKTYKKAIKNADKVLSITYVKDKVDKTLISDCVKKYNVDISILLGNIEEINHKLIGILVIKIDGTTEQIDSCINYLKENEVIVEEVSYE